MNLATTLGVSLAALTVAASATPLTRVFIQHGGMAINFDANGDGWVSRAEAEAAADRAFEQLDSNDDNRLDQQDRAAPEADLEIVNGPHIEMSEDCETRVEPAGAETPRAGTPVERRVTVICRHGDGDVSTEDRRITILRGGEHVDEREIERIEREVERHVERAERDAERAARDAERLAEDAERAAEHAERRIERHVVVINGEPGDALAPLPPMPPMPPHPPMFMMFMASDGEADTNGDGALSREEFRAQQLRYFDAGDANGDGRVRLPQPPAPPAAPEPPAPPRHR